MQIDAVELYRLALPLKKPLPAPHAGDDRLETVLVRLQSGELSGWGESTPGKSPRDSAEWSAGAFAVLKDWLAPAVVGRRIGSGGDLQNLLDVFRGNRSAKAALDMAWWDLHARQKEKPLHETLGGKNAAVEVGPTFDRMDSLDDFFAAIGSAFEAGFARVKLMFRPGWDIRMLEAVRKEFPRQTFHVDLEEALTIHHSEILYRLDDFFLAMVEQPLPADDLVGHAMLQEALRTPICLGRGIRTASHAAMALELHSCQFVNLSISRVGGLTTALAIHDLCHESCTPCYVGAGPQTAIAARHGYALAAKENCSYPAEYFPTAEILAADVADPLLPSRGEDGKRRIHQDASPGIGVEPNREVLEKYCVERMALGP
ncbi:MAG: o-succinylbenzoate synthase [Pirellulales bacterium]|nr:o-succinylbenzoate synthase [Pirellulales bacterium]